MSEKRVFLLFFSAIFHAFSVSSVPFVTKRVSLHNPIDIDFGGWRPIQSAPAAPTDALLASASQPVLQEAPSAPLERHFLTVPVAVETDAEHVLSETEINQIREHVITNWKQKPEKSESFGAHVRPLVTKLLPKPEVELTVEETAPEGSHESPDRSGDENEYTFVKMDKNADSSAADENLFHAYFAPKEHIPPDGYVRLTRHEFKALFKNAEILFI